jgi:hypothetical protein
MQVRAQTNASRALGVEGDDFRWTPISVYALIVLAGMLGMVLGALMW